MQIIPKTCSLLSMIVIISFIIVVSIDIPSSWAQSVSIVSTRGHFNVSSGDSLSNESYNQVGPGFFNNICLNEEVLIYVHGVWTNTRDHTVTSVENAEEVIDRLRMSLESVGYDYPLVGFSWDSDTTIDKQGKGWNIAKYVAKENGHKLAEFISDLKEHCVNENSNDIQVRLIGHSLGSRVILSALDGLDKDADWNTQGFKILTVNLLGGAVDNYEVLKANVSDSLDAANIKHYYGYPIEDQVLNFYNMYNPEDDILETKYWTGEWGEPIYYPFFEEGNLAIGQTPLIEGTFGMPERYKNVNVQDELIVDIDADNDAASLANSGCDLPNVLTSDPSDCTINGEGDNHLGYIGFRNSDNSLFSEGAIDKVVDTWRTS